jgi:leucyl aminopeptidase
VSLSVEVVGAEQLPSTDTVAVFAVAPEGDGPPTLVAGLPVVTDDARVPSQLDAEECRREGFTAKVGQVLRIRADGPRVLAVGLGPAASLTDDRWRRGGAAVVRAGGHGGTAAVLIPADAPGAAIAEGAILAAYRFDDYRSKPSPRPLERLVIGVQEAALDEQRDAVRRGVASATAVTFARDLINTPPSDLNPTQFATRVAEHLEGRRGTSVEVWDESRIEEERLGGLLTVARGSVQPPRVVIARYTPQGGDERAALPHVVLVGKGITFDSGGLSLKTPDGMMTMKTDMSGAAIVMAALSACGDVGVPVAVTAIAMATENMPGPNAVKPGDVFRARNGATVEVLNTDAEGRLVLADGLSLAAELQPDAIIDVATLTGAAVSALGRGVGALFGSDDTLANRLQEIGEETGEALWRLPLPEQYADHIDSDVADMKNIGRAGEAGAIAAALLLARFTGDSPWAHLDIAGPARANDSSGYLSKGGTAFGVRTLLEYLRTGASVAAG